MAGKRKRNRHSRSTEDRPGKRLRGGSDGVGESGSATSVNCDTINHPVLSLYYPCVVTLRRYLLSKLPISSKARRRRLLATGSCAKRSYATNVDELIDGSDDDSHGALPCLLDTTLVCGLERSYLVQDQSRINDLATFSQHQSKSTAGSSPGRVNCSQSEVRLIHSLDVHFSVQSLFGFQNGS